jgi:NAD(P)-dependent dehydrogenase (short-subunit alcohol dehydrogenase family)
MTRTLATEAGGVRLTRVVPGTIETDGWRGYGDRSSVAATIPLGGWVPPRKWRRRSLPGLARRRPSPADGRDRRRRR